MASSLLSLEAAGSPEKPGSSVIHLCISVKRTVSGSVSGYLSVSPMAMSSMLSQPKVAGIKVSSISLNELRGSIYERVHRKKANKAPHVRAMSACVRIANALSRSVAWRLITLPFRKPASSFGYFNGATNIRRAATTKIVAKKRKIILIKSGILHSSYLQHLVIGFFGVIFVPLWDLYDDIRGAVGNGLAAQSRFLRDAWRHVQFVELGIGGFVAGFETLFDDDVTRGAGADAAAGVVQAGF